MLVRDFPMTFDLAQAESFTRPDARLGTIDFFPADPHEAVAEGDVLAGGDAEVAHLKADGAITGGEPFLLIALQRRGDLKWRSQGKPDFLLREICRDSLGILGTDRLRPHVEYGADFEFIVRFVHIILV